MNIDQPVARCKSHGRSANHAGRPMWRSAMDNQMPSRHPHQNRDDQPTIERPPMIMRALQRLFGSSNRPTPEQVREAYIFACTELDAELQRALRAVYVLPMLGPDHELNRKTEFDVREGAPVVSLLLGYMLVQIVMRRRDRSFEGSEANRSLKTLAINTFGEAQTNFGVMCGSDRPEALRNALRLVVKDFPDCDERVRLSIRRFANAAPLPFDPILAVIDQHFPDALGTSAEQRDKVLGAATRRIASAISEGRTRVSEAAL